MMQEGMMMMMMVMWGKCATLNRHLQCDCKLQIHNVPLHVGRTIFLCLSGAADAVIVRRLNICFAQVTPHLVGCQNKQLSEV